MSTVDLDGPLHHVDTGGAPGAPTIVLVHGLGASHLSWHPLIERLAATHRVLAPDLVGFGHSEPLGRSASVLANRALLVRYIREVAGGPVVLAGNSMGGMISTLAASTHPDLVEALVLVNPALPGTVTTTSLRAVDPQLALHFALYNTPVIGEQFLRLRRRRTTPAQQVRELLDLLCTDASRVPHGTVEALVELAAARRHYGWSDRAFLVAERSLMRQLTVGRRSYASALAGLRMPTLLVHGEDDRLIDVASARAVAARNPGIDLVTLPGVGHVPQLEVPDQLHDLLVGWLAGVAVEDVALSPAGHVAAHSPETARAGLEALQAGGTAADAAAAMTIAACVVEPMMVSLLSGMHAIHVDAAGRTTAVDGFVDVPAITDGGRTAAATVVFDTEEFAYAIGGATFGTPGLVAGCAALVADHGRLPWAEVLAPAQALAAEGFVMQAEDAVLLAILEPVMTMDLGARVFRRADGTLCSTGDRILLPGVDQLLAQLAEQGPGSLYTGDLAVALAGFCADVGSLVDATDLAACTAVRHTPPAVRLGRHVVRTRRGLSPLSDWLDALSRRPTTEPTVVRLAAVQEPDVPIARGTTSMAVVDAEGNACAVTASLGLGTGDWFGGQQLNSMLGESDLLRGPLRPRTRMGSMMAPTAILAPDGTTTVLGAAGGSRIPSAVLRVADGIIDGGLDPVAAVGLPRLHRTDRTVHVEPHLPETDEAALRAAGWEVTRWTTRHHFFGGVSIAGPAGAEGDPRRGGLALAQDPGPGEDTVR